MSTYTVRHFCNLYFYKVSNNKLCDIKKNCCEIKKIATTLFLAYIVKQCCRFCAIRELRNGRVTKNIWPMFQYINFYPSENKKDQCTDKTCSKLKVQGYLSLADRNRRENHYGPDFIDMIWMKHFLEKVDPVITYIYIYINKGLSLSFPNCHDVCNQHKTLADSCLSIFDKTKHAFINTHWTFDF